MAATPRTNRRRPNILFVLADDLDLAELRALPHVHALVGTAGTTFDQYLVSNSLCCPSRTTTLRGQYAHNTGVWTNGGDNGGFERAHANGVEQDTVATRLHHGGYTTSLVGKYLNGYPNGARPDDVPPGWDNWASAVYGNPYSEYGYVLNQNQAYHVYQHRPQDYGTDVYVGLTDRFIRGASREHRPFFAYLSVYAPHQPATPARVDRRQVPSRTRAAHPELRPGRREPRAGVRARPAPVQPRGVARHQRAVPQAAPFPAGARPRRRAPGAHVARDEAAREHVHRVRVGQRVPPRPAPHAGREADAVRDRHPRAAARARSRRARRRARHAARRQHRPRPDVRGDGRGARAVVHRRPIAAPPAARRPARALAHLLPARAPRRDRA